ncbi:unnamed protein product [Rhizoctonia solani]|uniref:Uncharacterized protein n=1 Tax=Rhizoctonia solani TaxID=456999 RepID=A0A8H3DZY8_9AGAM|nr:unnamed protein product [Rhizoctonia solani]
MQTNARRVMAIPELLDMVTHELDGKDLRILMHVSKSFFNAAGPLAWKSVPRIEVIMRLIDGVHVHRKVWDGGRLTITLPPKLHFGRYNIYAHWVQALHIDGGNVNSLKIINLDSFASLLDGRSPLPNLRQLTASAFNRLNESLRGVINLFMSPLLVEIRVILPQDPRRVRKRWGSRVPSSYDPEFLEKLKISCPDIKIIEFYLNRNYVPEHDWFTHCTPSDRIRAALSSFTNLRSFSSSVHILEPAIIGVIGELPHLESLGIQGMSWPSSVLDPQLSIPQTWFPVLKHLQLRRIPSKDIQTLWRQPSIVGKLVSLVIHADVESWYTGNWVSPFLKALPGLSPRLEDVIFSVHVTGWSRSVEIPRYHWDIFKGEPLATAVITYQNAVSEGRIA